MSKTPKSPQEPATLTVTRRRLTPAIKLAEIDEQITKAAARLEELRARRTALVIETKQAAADLLAQVSGDE